MTSLIQATPPESFSYQRLYSSAFSNENYSTNETQTLNIKGVIKSSSWPEMNQLNENIDPMRGK